MLKPKLCEGGNPTIDNDSEYCDAEGCTACCNHDERDHGICLDCGHEEDPGSAIHRAIDYYEDR